MSNPHRTPTPPSTKRLLHELQHYTAEPNDALLQLGPISDEQILHWEAILKGVKESGYEGATATISYSVSTGNCLDGNCMRCTGPRSGSDLFGPSRGPVEDRHPDTGELPAGAAGDALRDANLSPECPFQGRGSPSHSSAWRACLQVWRARLKCWGCCGRLERSVWICSRRRGRQRTAYRRHSLPSTSCSRTRSLIVR